jgi:hypothetical protein
MEDSTSYRPISPTNYTLPAPKSYENILGLSQEFDLKELSLWRQKNHDDPLSLFLRKVLDRFVVNVTPEEFRDITQNVPKPGNQWKKRVMDDFKLSPFNAETSYENIRMDTLGGCPEYFCDICHSIQVLRKRDNNSRRLPAYEDAVHSKMLHYRLYVSRASNPGYKFQRNKMHYDVTSARARNNNKVARKRGKERSTSQSVIPKLGKKEEEKETETTLKNVPEKSKNVNFEEFMEQILSRRRQRQQDMLRLLRERNL